GEEDDAVRQRKGDGPEPFGAVESAAPGASPGCDSRQARCSRKRLLGYAHASLALEHDPERPAHDLIGGGNRFDGQTPSLVRRPCSIKTPKRDDDPTGIASRLGF